MTRLLIVDDNPDFLEAAGNLLSRQGLDVLGVASTGAEAVRLARELRPDVVLLDIDLGRESGFDVAMLLADDPARTIVLISAYGESEFGELIESSPARGFISKSDLSGRAIEELRRG
jgi:DNA-binding NarL/FixJ family response regulator